MKRERCNGCRLKPMHPNTIVACDAATNLWLVNHGAEIGWSVEARAHLAARICNVCGRAIDKRRKALRPDSDCGLRPQ
jgi:hypothetical protein